MRRVRNPSPATFFNELLYRYTQNPAFAEFHEPFDGFAAAIRSGTPDRYQAGDGAAVPGDDELLTAFDPL
jgi:hypothetical protein